MTDKEILLKAASIVINQPLDDRYSVAHQLQEIAHDLPEKPEPVRLPDGSIENFTVKVVGKPFQCSCGCNVFQKLDRNNMEHYTCNACSETYAGG